MVEPVTSLELFFENCDSLTIPREAIKFLAIDSISSSISLEHSPDLIKVEYANCKSAGIAIDAFVLDKLKTKIGENPWVYIKGKSIVGVTINHKDYYFPWTSSKRDDTVNLNQAVIYKGTGIVSASRRVDSEYVAIAFGDNQEAASDAVFDIPVY